MTPQRSGESTGATSYCYWFAVNNFSIHNYLLEDFQNDIINSATKLVIPAAAERRAGIQKRPCDYWIPAFARMTRWWISVGLCNCQVNSNISAKNTLHSMVLSKIIKQKRIASELQNSHLTQIGWCVDGLIRLPGKRMLSRPWHGLCT